MYYYRRLRDLREDNDLTQKTVAQIIGTTQQVYSEYEKGIREIPLYKMIILADYYDVSVDYIVGRTDNKYSHK